MAIGLLILRLVVGLTLAAHGAQKLFGWFGGYGLQGTGGFLEQLGFVPGRRNALFAGLAELGGGVLLALGLATPVAAAMIVAVMTVAAVSAHLKHGFFNHNQGYEYTLILAIASVSIAFTGPGPLSVDATLGFGDAGAAWGFVALVAGLAGAAVQLARRQVPGAKQSHPSA
ncbi:MAG TPA: DoxX family protein [Gemmatimonadales bacterium]|nr:DoxX family protein [Gemmatimonadales bacterium]